MVTSRLPFLVVVSVLGGCMVMVCGNIVTTNNGKIEGVTQTVDGVQLDTYLGVPFAAPPLGDLRFRAPQDVANWTGVKETKTQPNCCVQTADTSFNRFYGVEMWNCNTNVSEDCLYLNLWVPRSSDGSKLTTMVWIYGGSFTYGSSTLDVYDGTYLAVKENVIVASMQYRMSAHGFVYTGTEEAPGNVGLRDQQMAMKWVYENIEHFGGDQNQITLFGESAGSASVSYHLIIPSSVPYFNNAIMQSATFVAHWAYRDKDIVLARTKKLAELMNCDTNDMSDMIGCLRQADVMDIENNQWSIGSTDIGLFGIVADGDFIPTNPTYLLNSGKLKDTNLLLGTTRDEGEYFLLYFYQDIIKPENLWNPKPLNRSEYVDIAGRISGLDSSIGMDLLLYVYEMSNLPSTRGTYWHILDDLFGDYTFKCSVNELARWNSKYHSNRGTYVYRFDYINSNNPWPSYLGSLHGYEIESIFGIPFNPKYNYTVTDKAVSTAMMSYFATFAKTGNVNKRISDLATWPKFTVDSEDYLTIADTNTVAKGFRTKECSFWRDIAPKLALLSDTSRKDGYTSGSECRSASGFFTLSAILFLVSFHLLS